jgi:hypothetical protein
VKYIGLILVVSVFIPHVAEAVGEPPPDIKIVESVFRVTHHPPPACEPYRQLPIIATVECDQPELLSVELHFRTVGDTMAYYSRPMSPLDIDRFEGVVPARIVGGYGVEYFIIARKGRGVAPSGSVSKPYKVYTSYSYDGTVPDDLPGDEFLEEYEPPVERDFSMDEQQTESEIRKPSTFGIQILVVLIIATVVYLIYQRFGP